MELNVPTVIFDMMRTVFQKNLLDSYGEEFALRRMICKARGSKSPKPSVLRSMKIDCELAKSSVHIWLSATGGAPRDPDHGRDNPPWRHVRRQILD